MAEGNEKGMSECEERELTKEQEENAMSNWYDDERLGSGKFVSIKEGKEVELTIKSIGIDETVGTKFQPKDKDGNSQGWALRVITTEEKILDVGTYVLQRALKESKVGAGDTIVIKHLSHSNYEVIVKERVSEPEEEPEEGKEPEEEPEPEEE